MRFIQTDDFETVKAGYIDVISHTPKIPDHCRWEYGKHPSDEDLRGYIERGEMYVLTDQETVAGMVAITVYQGEDYEAVNWEQKLANDEVAVLHLLAVLPAFQGNHLGKIILSEALDIAKVNGKRALRLDTLKTNLPAQHMYQTAGFSFRGEQSLLLYENEKYDFMYYEKKLR